MNSDRKADYYVGLDMGTGSLGVAVTDPQYHLLKVKEQRPEIAHLVNNGLNLL